jgi:serine/threonine protein kinase
MAGHKFDRFREIKIIGAGAFGKTVLVEDQTQGSRRVVIKVPLTEETETALINDLINNAVLQTSLKEMSHANIAHYLGFDRYDGRFVMILEYVKGRDLRKILGPAQSQSRPRMDLGLALRIAVDVCSGLVAAHAARVFHSDIKPENILVRDEDGVAKICDFGISQIMRSTAATETGGTVPYMAPEALGGKASFPADLWSLSVTLYEMATGALPFAFPQGCDIFAFKTRLETEEPVQPKKLNPKINDVLNDLIMHGLEKNLDRRFHKAQDMLAALEAYLRGEDPITIELSGVRELMQQSKEAEAETMLNRLLQRYPQKAEIYLTLGEVFTRGVKPTASESILRKGVAQCPAHPALHLNLAMVLNTQKKRTEAIDTLEKAIQLGLGRQGPYAEALLRNWRAGRG